MRPFDNFIVKVYELCNINCKYCYMYNLEDNSFQNRPLSMSNEVQAHLFSNLVRHVKGHGLKEIVVYMHGGEPLMAGKAYISKWIDSIRDNLEPYCKLNVSLQTNGMLLDDEWIYIFQKRNVRLGISLDGPKALHDAWRVDKKNEGTYDRVRAKISLLHSHDKGEDVFGSILSVANPDVAPSDLWDCWTSTGFTRFDFNLPHCTHDSPPPFTNAELTAWLIALFDIWWHNNDPRIDIRFFRNLLFMILGTASSVDYIGGEEIGLIVVETDGSIQGTDALRACKDGLIETGLNVCTDEIQSAMDLELVQSSNYGASVLCEKCRNCEVVTVCGGGYFPHRYSQKNGFNNASVYCEALEGIIRHVKHVVVRELAPVAGAAR